ncbi:RICIN domain-containing protein [Loktanella sp. F6476L]|uniref:ricin-type beta-trefoil lectin domain protein n=1 Tax=Loktanella sp. F6476L TaxID=2926405 RepID=UPI001FF10701|nr:ricin-type beta-trefoil lectin domain protein [Loktanella sp. F6476L]MCK0120741.1 RICIN domain-containing protein [Loktanella sp. F6476L]
MLHRTAIAAVSAAILTTTPAFADSVEIYLVDMLDNTQNGYCVDIARAQGTAANPDDGLQGHTCYSPSGELMVDQIFDTEKFADNVLYMPEFDVCAEIASDEAGTTIDLATCDGSDAQAFNFSGEGTITPVSNDTMCFTVAEDTRTGRSDANQIKVLSLETCTDDNAANQTWNVRTASE